METVLRHYALDEAKKYILKELTRYGKVSIAELLAKSIFSSQILQEALQFLIKEGKIQVTGEINGMEIYERKYSGLWEKLLSYL